MALAGVLLPVFLVVAAGFGFSRRLRAPMEPLAQLSLYVATPALVLEALVRHPVPAGELGRLALLMLAYSAVLWAVAEAAARLMGLDDPLRRAFVLAVVPMNVGNYGIPLVRLAFGPEAEPFAIVVFVVFNIPLASWAIWLAAGGGSAPWKGLRETLRMPILHATVAAFALSTLGLSLPGPLAKGLALLGEAAIPLLLVVLGMQLERTRVVSARPSVLVATVLRLGVAPLVAWGLTAALGFGGLEQRVLVLQTSTPAAVLPLLYALRFDCRPDWVASTLLVSTLASGVTLAVVLRFVL